MAEGIDDVVVAENSSRTANDAAVPVSTTPKSPLSPLRLSVPSFEINSSNSAKKVPSTSQSASNSAQRDNTNTTKGHRSANVPFLPRKRSKDGFDLDFSVPDIDNEVNEDDSQEVRRIPIIKEEGENEHTNSIPMTGHATPKNKMDVKKIGELSSLLLDTRRSLQYDCNVADSIKHKEGPDPTNEHSIKISKVSLARAEKVRSMIGVKYFHIQRMFEASAHHAHVNVHPGVEGVYNPIQIIRNRALRAKYHDYPKELAMKSIPLACNVFSKNNRDPDHPWKLIWAIELKEFLGDYNFRAHHWHELVNPKGQLWFPPSTSSSTAASTDDKMANGGDLRQRLHDKLFSSEESIAKRSSTTPSTSKQQRRESTATTASTDSDKLKITRTKSPASKRIKDRVKRHTRKFYNGTSSSSTADEDSETNGNYIPNTKDPIKQQMFKKVSLSPELENDEDESMDNNSVSLHNSKSAIAMSVPSFRVESLDDQNEPLEISNVVFAPIEKKEPENPELRQAEKSEIEHEENAVAPVNSNPLIQVTTPPVPPLDAKELEFQVMLNDFSYFEQVINLKSNYLLKIYPNYTHAIGTKLSNILHNKLYTVFHATTKISDDYLPEYEDLYQGFSNEVKSVAHMINDDYSVRIDNLLSNSDRSISEINASLSLELRKINEKLDKLDTSLFGNSVTNRLKESHLKIKEKDNYTLLYFCLENFIVILLRVVWILVNLYKGVELTLKFIWRIIRFILS